MSDAAILAAITSAIPGMTRSRETGSGSAVDAAKRALLAKLLRREGMQWPAPRSTVRARHRPLRRCHLRKNGCGFSINSIPELPSITFPAPCACAADLDTGALAKSLDAIVQRHEILRTRFRSGIDGPVQQALPRISLNVPVIDLSGLSGTARRRRCNALGGASEHGPFDLAVAPLLRARLIKLGNTDHVLLWVLHQLVCDGWSMRLFCRELEFFIDAMSAAELRRLAALPIQYRDYALGQRERFQAKPPRQQLAYWRERLRDSLPASLCQRIVRVRRDRLFAAHGFL